MFEYPSESDRKFNLFNQKNFNVEKSAVASLIQDNPKNNDLAIILPTQNRPFYLYRTLRFYENQSLPFKIHLADSSVCKNKDLVRKIVRDSNLNIKIHDYKYGICATKKFNNTLADLDEEFFLMIADDDFIIPSSISRCIKFLKENEDYSVAHGRSYRFTIIKNKDIKITRYLQHCLEMSDPITRFKAHMEDWSTTAYSVQRTKNVKEIVQFYSGFTEDIRSMEIYWYASNVIRGKVAKLNLPYMFRQFDSPKEWRHDDYNLWVNKAKYRDGLIEKLSDELAKVSGLEKSLCANICRSSIANWINDHRPFQIKNILGYSLKSYRNRYLKKARLWRLSKEDALAVETIKRYI
jgi:glycosyltransferase domain-containing protein